METVIALMRLGVLIIAAMALGWLFIYAIFFAIAGIGAGAYWVICKLTGKDK